MIVEIRSNEMLHELFPQRVFYIEDFLNNFGNCWMNAARTRMQCTLSCVLAGENVSDWQNYELLITNEQSFFVQSKFLLITGGITIWTEFILFSLNVNFDGYI